MSEISQEVIERMVALVRKMEPEGSHSGSYTLRREDYVEAHAIAALLPEPVDPDLIEARELAFPGAEEFTDEIAAGKWDTHPVVLNVFRAIKRGRALERAK